MAHEYPEALADLMRLLAKLPGVGQRSAERLGLALLEWDDAALRDLASRLATLKGLVRPCTICGNLADAERCRICADEQRDHGLLCIVEQSRQIPVIEKSGRFRGIYHVLGGRLAPLDGVAPEDLNLETLYARIPRDGVREIILATSPDVEGEATASYLAEELRARFPVALSRIALGVPVGSDLSYADSATMALAIESRRQLK